MSNVDVITSRFETNINKLIAEQKVSQAQEVAKLTAEIHSTVYKIVGLLCGLIVVATFAATVAAFAFRHTP
jgi:hypothetical protein